MINQRIFVEKILRKEGSITRNFCLRNYISRLGAIITVLKTEGYCFKTNKIPAKSRWGKTYDYEYKLIDKPDKPVHYTD